MGHEPRTNRRWWIVPALAFSLVVGPAVPLAGVDGVADHAAEHSACIGPAAEPTGFTDMAGSFAESAADCLAYYGITKGTSVGMFSPNVVIPRWQMALFLARAAVPAGIVLPRASDQGFTDLDGLGPHTKEAINQLVALRIMAGTSDSTFAPLAEVTRQEMAVWLSGFLRVAPTGPGGTNIRSVTVDDDVFRDLRQVPFDTHTAIRNLYEMGVTTGTSPNTFSPNRRVSRGQMAVFIARMLAHTNARPVGLTAQLAATEVFRDSDVRLSVSVRDSGGQPFEGQIVDVFTATDPDEAFDEDGVCTDHVLPAAGGEVCEIELADKSTGVDGNLLIDIEVGNVESLRIWVWGGNRGSSFDEDRTEAVVLDIRTLRSASGLEVSDDLRPTTRKARFGDAVTFTFRLVDDQGVPVLRPGVKFTIRAEESRDNGRNFESTTFSKETGPDGTARVTFRHLDPSGDAGDIARLDLDVRSNSANLAVRDKTTIGIVERDNRSSDRYLDWADEPEEPTTLRMSMTKPYQLASSQGAGSAATVRATLTDQYGAPVAGEFIVFTSNDSLGVPSGVRKPTNSSGVASLNYQRDSAASRGETITGKFDGLVASARQYWVARVSADASGSGEVRVIETDTNALVVVTSSSALLMEYDSNDRLSVGKTSVSISTFEQNLTVGDTLTYEITGPDDRAVNSFTLTNR